MSMFKSPAEISSSDSESDSDDIDVQKSHSPSRHSGKSNSQPISGDQAPKRLDPSEDFDASGSLEDVSVLSQDAMGVNVDRHANVMTAALLEFYCQTRAADILNAQKGSQRNFTRTCPEAQYLGKKLYQFKSQFLSSHGVLADGVEQEDMGPTRQTYRDNLDLLGLSALEDMNLNEPPVRSPIESGDELALVSTSSHNRHALGAAPNTTQFWRDDAPHRDFSQQAPHVGKIDVLGGIPTGSRNSPISSRPLFGSSPVSVPLFDAPTAPAFNHMSRYSVEFSELKVLGRGSFGEVYHVKNHIDGQDYAVKKIPLSQRRLDQLQFGGQNQLEIIMKEIRTLARLEHTNVVRYYGAWVEQAHVSNPMPFNQQMNTTFESSQVQPHSPGSTNEPSMGIVFENSESSAVGSHPSSAPNENDHSSRIQRWGSHATTSSGHSKKSSKVGLEDDDEVESIPRNLNDTSYGQTSTFGETDDIFTDGLSQDQSKLQLQRPYRPGQQTPAVILHIQMSLHPLSLSSYLNPQAMTRRDSDDCPLPRRHCFHLMPSLKMMLDIVSGVEYLHSKDIVHRDLKPANIFLSTPENKSPNPCIPCGSGANSPVHFCRPRIGDFGLVADISHFNESSTDGTVTPYRDGPKIQRVVGTEFYRPPANTDATNSPIDYFDDYKIDEKLDVYALGVILFELVYRLNTKMERQLVLNDLTHGSVSFPNDFADKIDQGEVMLDNGVSVADSLVSCIEGMVIPQSRRRSSCRDVKEHLRQIYKSVKKLHTTHA